MAFPHQEDLFFEPVNHTWAQGVRRGIAPLTKKICTTPEEIFNPPLPRVGKYFTLYSFLKAIQLVRKAKDNNFLSKKIQ